MEAKFKERDIVKYIVSWNEGSGLYEIQNEPYWDEGGDGYEPEYWYSLDRIIGFQVQESKLKLVCRAENRED